MFLQENSGWLFKNHTDHISMLSEKISEMLFLIFKV